MAKQNNTITVDVHNLYVADALQCIRDKIAQAPHTTEKIIVVHGYNNGTAIKEALRKLHSPRILEIAPSPLNPGITTLWLKRS